MTSIKLTDDADNADNKEKHFDDFDNFEDFFLKSFSFTSYLSHDDN